MIILLNQFQSTPPRRRRLCSPSFSFFPKFISIHASAKEATLFTLIFIFPQIYFNPRLREGGDEHLTQYKIFYSYFNPRLREGGDALLMILIGIGIDFNPRLREGGDGSGTPTVYTPFDFNPRLREGGDRQHLIS